MLNNEIERLPEEPHPGVWMITISSLQKTVHYMLPASEIAHWLVRDAPGTHPTREPLFLYRLAEFASEGQDQIEQTQQRLSLYRDELAAYLDQALQRPLSPASRKSYCNSATKVWIVGPRLTILSLYIPT